MTLPSYYHLSPTQIDGLSFIITLKNDSGENEEQQFHIRWQEKIHSSNNDAEPSQVSVLTYTNEDVIANNQTDQGFIQRSDLDSYSAATRSRMERLLREDEYQTFVIAAKTKHDDEAVLCVIKLYPDSGQLSSTPQFSEVESEDFEDRLFLSDSSISKILERGQRLTTHSFSTTTGCLYEYTIQCPTIDEDNRNMDNMLAEQRILDREDARREKIYNELQDCDSLYDGSNDVFTHAAHVELISIEGDAFVQSNLLLSQPHGSNISVQYKVVESTSSTDKWEERLLLEGSTSSVSSCSSVRKSLEFVSNFIIAFIGAAFVLMLWYGDYGHDYSLALLFTVVPLGLIINAAISGSDASLYHINHQFLLLFNNSSDTDKQPNQLVLELKVFFQNNFGFESLAGCGTVNIPTEAGTYDLQVPTWKPIACPGVGETEGRMYDYFLGSSCEVGPQDPMPTELELSKDTDIRLLSKAGLHTKSTGSVRLKINIMPNFFKDKIKAEVVDNHHHRVKMRETVDEVLTRVRLNKIERVRRSRTSLP